MRDAGAHAASDDTSPVRQTEQLDWQRLDAYLRAAPSSPAKAGHYDAARALPIDRAGGIEVRQFAGGHSNLTYLLRFGTDELVLRRPPLGPVAPTAHDMAREFRWLSALAPIFPLAPRPLLLCDDVDVLGCVFYIMERRKGLVIRGDEPAALAGRPDLRERLSGAVVDALADLHRLDVTDPALSPLGKPAGFVARQVRGWSERWRRSQTSDLPEMDAVSAWLQKHLPPDTDRPTVVHGDFKLDNVMLDEADVTRLTAVFDWEMSSLGDPLVDLAILLTYWSRVRPGDSSDALATVTKRQGWFTREHILDRYTRRTGRDVSSIRFYETFAVFKIAVIIQQIYFRYAHGQTDDPRFARFDARVAQLARDAAALAQTL
jgi:aminoglycoside phosphotransferase (APT) family kinase protein